MINKEDNMEHYKHEALDRTLTIQVLIQEILEDHPFIKGDLKDKLTAIQEDLADFYQAVGND